MQKFQGLTQINQASEFEYFAGSIEFVELTETFIYNSVKKEEYYRRREEIRCLIFEKNENEKEVRQALERNRTAIPKPIKAVPVLKRTGMRCRSLESTQRMGSRKIRKARKVEKWE